MPRPRSRMDYNALTDALLALQDMELRYGAKNSRLKTAIVHVSQKVRQVRNRIDPKQIEPRRRNPALVVYNPPDLRVRRMRQGNVAGQIASNVHQIKYEHADDGQPYVHDFEPGVMMFALESRGDKEILLTGDKPLWGDF